MVQAGEDRFRLGSKEVHNDVEPNGKAVFEQFLQQLYRGVTESTNPEPTGTWSDESMDRDTQALALRGTDRPRYATLLENRSGDQLYSQALRSTGATYASGLPVALGLVRSPDNDSTRLSLPYRVDGLNSSGRVEHRHFY